MWVQDDRVERIKCQRLYVHSRDRTVKGIGEVSPFLKGSQPDLCRHLPAFRRSPSRKPPYSSSGRGKAFRPGLASRTSRGKVSSCPQIRQSGPAVRVLLADDHRLYAESLMAVLSEDERVDVVGIAADGEEAVRLAAEFRPDVILMDLMMPVMDGLEATRRIRATGLPVQILVLTGDADSGGRGGGRRGRCDGVPAQGTRRRGAAERLPGGCVARGRPRNAHAAGAAQRLGVAPELETGLHEPVDISAVRRSER